MAEYRWSAPAAIATALSTELNSLANDANAITGTQVDNTTNRKTFIDVELVLASVDLSSQTNPAIYIWFLYELDGTNQEDGAAGVNPAKAPDVIIPLREVNGAQRVIIPNTIVLPYEFDILVGNRSGAALASSGNTLKYRLHSMEDN